MWSRLKFNLSTLVNFKRIIKIHSICYITNLAMDFCAIGKFAIQDIVSIMNALKYEFCTLPIQHIFYCLLMI